MRKTMVKTQIEARGIRNKKVLHAMNKVPRHLFVDEKLAEKAYNDYPLPIGEGQTISQPYIVALMTELLDPDINDRILEIGTGSGYQAAVLAEIVKKVYTIEIIPSLTEKAADALEKTGYSNVELRTGDGFLGWEEEAPFDGIIVTCAPGEVPQPLVDQLKEGGKLVIPVGEMFQQLQVFEKKNNKIEVSDSIAVRFVPMTGISQGEVVLPRPKYKGRISVEEAISRRTSIRSYKNKALSLSEVSQMLWAAGGRRTDAVTEASRTFPSAGGRYPVTIYLFAGNVTEMPAGLYRYQWEEHKLKMIKAGDLRNKLAEVCLGQEMLKNAPATIVFSALEKKTTSRYGERGRRYVSMDVAHAGENLYLQAVGLDLGTVAVGSFDDKELEALIGVRGEFPLYVFPFGKLK